MKKNLSRRSILFSAMAISGGSFLNSNAQVVPTNNKPNVIFINADDLGIGMLGCYGQKVIKTPHIDRLASEGMKFTNYYGGVLCAPARWTLLTGMHDGRKGGWGHTGAGLPIKRDAGKITEEEFQEGLEKLKKTAMPIATDEIFLGQIAQQSGYRTAQFGKLDVGFLTWHDRIKRYGWDHYEGYMDHQRAHGFYPPYLWRNGERFDLEGNTRADCGKMSEKGDEPVGDGGKTYSQNIFIDSILKYIRENKDHSFFIYFPTQLPHGPVAIPALHPEFANNKKMSLGEKKYASMIKMLDDHVGMIIQELKAQGLDKKTAVFFTSDNGHELYYGPKPEFHRGIYKGKIKVNLTDRKWRTSECGDIFDGAGGRAGLKRSAYQGGMQCPLIVRWPGKVKPATSTDLLSAHYDFMATLGEIVGSKIPDGKDSISYLPTLLGKTQKQKHDYVFVNNGFKKMGRTALISAEGWKLVEIDRNKNQFQLYNILKDNEERYNLEGKHPEKVQTLKKKLLQEVDSERPDLIFKK